MATAKPWQIWIDTGGTFTDCLAFDPTGGFHQTKVLSSGALRGVVEQQLTPATFQVRQQWNAPDDFVRQFAFAPLGGAQPTLVSRFDAKRSIITLATPWPGSIAPETPFEVCSPEEAPLLAARLVTETPYGDELPTIAMRLATTRGTNALLERHGARVALFITAGFGDLLAIGTQQRPDLFALQINKPQPLYDCVVEVPERLAADGSVLKPLDLEPMLGPIETLRRQGITVASVALLHSYRNPQHERLLVNFLRGHGFTHVSCSAELAPFIKILPRAETTVVDAYLAPLINAYLANVQQPMHGGRLHVMTSAGGLVEATAYRPKESLLSGPAGGVVGAAIAGRQSGFGKVIAFDMGGTSTDVARFDGDYEYHFEQQVGDAHLVAPALAIESVAAGGGSICVCAKGRLQVGPESAGAHPGPACYGAGGPLTLTDVNLLLGRLQPERFRIPIQIAKAEAALCKVQHDLQQQTGTTPSRNELLEGFLAIANERMADAIRKISLRRGYDPREYVLVAFGGAGGQHACGVAERLGIETIMIPHHPGLLSAFGMGHAVIERFAERQVLTRLDQLQTPLEEQLDALALQAHAAVAAEGIAERDITVRRHIVNLRLVGQDFTLSINYDPDIPLRDAFAEQYRSVYGQEPEARPIEVESLRVVASSRDTSVMTRDTWGGSVWGNLGTPVIFEEHSAVVVAPNWSAQTDATGALILQQTAPSTRRAAPTTSDAPEAIALELFTNRFRALAEDMGEVLQRTALSTNVKERRDFSCTLLDPHGELVANAPHMPIHLGSMGLCVRTVRDAITMEPGDVIVTNHPAFGGSHLPDITVITPVYATQGELLGYVANRAHHAEIGGIRPGSMPPDATRLSEEGVVIPPMHLVKGGVPQWDVIQTVLEQAPYPTRSLADNLADLHAAVAANHRGAQALQTLAATHGSASVHHYMEALKQYAARRMREAIAQMPDGTYQAEEQLDDGSLLRVQMNVTGDHATLDFTGSAPLHPGNLNATPAIVRGAVIYVLRLMIAEALPLNEGLMRAVTLQLPEGMLNPTFPKDPTHAPAVVGGNVETSQRLVDTLLKALGLVACSQGTMNNVVFGTKDFGYYETVCGGAGAGRNFDGASAVHTHMTNTQITDPEIIEHRYPVRVERFAIRHGSGGAGRHRGGDGAIRELTFLQPMRLSLLSQHRSRGPYGLAGGEPGLPGHHRLIGADGSTVTLQAIDGCDVKAGDRFVLETPGGGGYGKKR